MPSTIAAELLLEIPLFRDLSVNEIRQLLAIADDRDYQPGAVVFREGTTDRALYVVLYGEVEIALPVDAWDQAVATTVAGPSVFGESSFFHAAPHAATAHCTTAVRAIRLTREAFDDLAGTAPAAAFKLARNAADILAQRLQETDRWVSELLQQQASAQVTTSWAAFRQRMGFRFEPLRFGP